MKIFIAGIAAVLLLTIPINAEANPPPEDANLVTINAECDAITTTSTTPEVVAACTLSATAPTQEAITQDAEHEAATANSPPKYGVKTEQVTFERDVAVNWRAPKVS